MAAIAGYMESLASLQKTLKDTSGHSIELSDDDEEADRGGQPEGSAPKSKTRPTFLELQKLAKEFGGETPSTDSEAYQPPARPRQSSVAARRAEGSWMADEALMGEQKTSISMNTDSDASEENGEKEEAEDGGDDPLGQMLRIAASRMQKGLKQSSQSGAAPSRKKPKTKVSTSSIAAAPGGEEKEFDLQSLCMLMLKKPKHNDDFEETGELDGLRVMKAMSRARAVPRNQEANPVRTCEQYHEN